LVLGVALHVLFYSSVKRGLLTRKTKDDIRRNAEIYKKEMQKEEGRLGRLMLDGRGWNSNGYESLLVEKSLGK
jgi:hypothetical protein